MSTEIKSDGRAPRGRRGSIFRRPSDFPVPSQSQLESVPKQHDQFQCFRNFLKIPREHRIWGTVEAKESAKECLEVLSKVNLLDRLDEVCLQKILMVCELVVMRKPQVLFEMGQEQTDAFLLISGTLILKSGSSAGWDHTESGEKVNALPTLNPLDTLGFKSLFSDWSEWPLSCMAGTNKVELIVIKKQDVRLLAQPLWIAFDSKSALDNLKNQAQFVSTSRRRASETSRPTSAALSQRSATPRGETEVDSVKVHGHSTSSQPPSPAPNSISITSSLRRIPFFRQFRSAFLQRISPSLRLHSTEQREILFRSQHYASDPKVGTSLEDRSSFLRMLHIVTTGRLWIFHRAMKDREAVRPQRPQDSDLKETGSLDILWGKPAEFCHTYGSFHSIHYPGNAVFGQHLPLDCTVIVEAGTNLIQVLDWERHLLNIKETIFVYQCESVRSVLVRPNHLRSNLDRTTLLSLLQDGVTFFKHIAPKHAAKLLETCSVRRFFAGDKLVSAGQPADRLFIVLNGFASEQHDTSDEQEAGRNVLTSNELLMSVVWSSKEKSGTSSYPIERNGKLFGVGDTVGEREVIERSVYFSTVTAEEEMEVIEIRQEVYETVLWDLCDGQAVPIERIEEILSCEPSVRDSKSVHELIDILDSSDFLQQFPREMQRYLTTSMVVVRFEPNCVVVFEGDEGQDMFIIISGSAALHSRKDIAFGQTLSFSTERHDGGASRPESLKDQSHYGGCTRVLGIGDSFGETAFLHLREHLATAITRTHAVMIKVQRGRLSKTVWQQLSEFVVTPSADALNRVFSKELEDRNENDTMLLVNSLGVNPFFSKMSYHALVECAQAFRRVDVSNLDSRHETNEDIKMTDDMVYVVNRGSLLACGTDTGPVLLHPTSFGSQSAADVLKSRQKPSGDGKTQTKGRQRSPQLWKTMQLESQYYGLFVVIKLQEGTRAENHLLNVAVRLMARYSMVTIDSAGSLAYLNEQEFQEIGAVRDVSECWRQQIVGFRFALAVLIASETVIFASNSIRDGKKLMDTLCSLSLFLKEHYVRNTILKSGSAWLRVGTDLKVLNFMLSDSGKLSYNVQKESPLDKGWFDICEMSECIEIKLVTVTWRDTERFGIEILHSSDSASEGKLSAGVETKVALFFQSQKERDQWADVLCLCAPPQTHRGLYVFPQAAESEQYEGAVRKIQGATVRFIKWIVSTREKAYTRMFMSEAERILIANDDRYKSTVFIGYGTAFVVNGFSTANEGTEILAISLNEWGLIERREHLRQQEALTRFLEKQPAIKLATRKDLAALSSSASVARFMSGNTIPISTFSDKQIVLIQDGVCTLGRVPKRLSKNFRIEATSDSRTKCTDCSGVGSVASFKITEKVHICPLCKGLGFVVDPVLNHPPYELVLLQVGTVLSELLSEGDSPADFELRAKSALTLIHLRKDLWDEIRDRRAVADAKSIQPEKTSAMAVFGAHHYSKSQLVLKTIERGRLSARGGQSNTIKTTDSKRVSGTIQALNSSDVVVMSAAVMTSTIKYRSRESKKISAILGGTMGGSAKRPQVSAGTCVRTGSAHGISLQSAGASTALAMPPPGTVKNPFAPPPPPQAPIIPKILDSDLRSALLKSFLDTARQQASSSKVPKLAVPLSASGAYTTRGDVGRTVGHSGVFLTALGPSTARQAATVQQDSNSTWSVEILRSSQLGSHASIQLVPDQVRTAPQAGEDSTSRLELLRTDLGCPELFASAFSSPGEAQCIKLGEFLAELRCHGLVDEGGTDRGRPEPEAQAGTSSHPIRHAIGIAEAVECFDEGVAVIGGSEAGDISALSMVGLSHALAALLRRRMLPMTPPSIRPLRPQIPPPIFRSQDERIPAPPPAAHRIVGTPRTFAAAYRRRPRATNPAGGGTSTGEEKGARYARREPWRSPFVQRVGAGTASPPPQALLPLPTVRRL